MILYLIKVPVRWSCASLGKGSMLMRSSLRKRDGMFSGNAAGAVRNFESCHHPSVLEGEVRRYEAAVKQAVAANTTTAAECLPSWSHVFRFDSEVLGWTFKPVPVGG